MKIFRVLFDIILFLVCIAFICLSWTQLGDDPIINLVVSLPFVAAVAVRLYYGHWPEET